MAATQPMTNDQYTPVTEFVPSPPRWFKGADDGFHLAYELLVTNTSPIPLTVASVEVLDADRRSSLAVLGGDELTAAMSSLADSSTPATTLAPSAVGVVWFELAFADQAAIPRAIEQQVTVNLPPEYAAVFASTTTGSRAEVDLRPPVVLGPPVLGSRWLAAGSCCDGPHRRALQSINGQLYLSQRFAIDFNLLDAQGRIADGDLGVNANHAGYGQPVFAVADATVASTVDGIPDQIEGNHYSITVENVTGNSIILDLGDGRYTFYAHLRPGTVAVQPGQHVQRGQQIGELGNSGSSHGAHLHFQVMDGPSAIGANGLPYVFDGFDLTGHGPPLAELAELYEAGQPLPIDASGAGPRQDALPLGGDELTFHGPEQLP
jgi:hypothetical protein